MQTTSLLQKFFMAGMLAVAISGTASAQTKPVKVLRNADTLITRNTVWDCDTIYFLGGKVYVTNNAELTIQPGTVITGDTTTKGTLIITRGSKIHAVGTPSCPIVFTSSRGPGRKQRGDWGGVIILGRASVNRPGGIGNIEGLPPSALTEYGGGATPNDNDNSGELSYVRIEYSGVALSPNNEINGLTFGGVGRGTLVDYVQVSFANDDSFEWFGGTVNAKHLIAFRGLDDDFDTDFGYSGYVQFGIVVRDPVVADVSGSSGFESDNDATSSTNLPQTRAVFSNITVSAGGDTTANANYRSGAYIRRNSHMYLYNSILLGFPTGVTIDGTSTNSNVQADTMVQNNIIAATQSSKWVVSTTSNTTVTGLLLNNAFNRFYTGNLTGPNLRFPYRLNNPDLRPNAGSPALAGANFNRTGLLGNSFFTLTTYVGALSRNAAQNWAQLWVNWTPNGTNYSTLCACTSAAPGAVTTAFSADEAKVETEKSVSVYPNPARGAFKVDLSGFNGNVQVKVTNMSGIAVYNKAAFAGSKTVLDVNLANASAGYYFVTVSDGKQSTTKKINIVQ